MYDGEHRVIGGNMTDQALLKFIGEDTWRMLDQSREYVITDIQGFNSANKFSQARIDSVGKTFYKGNNDWQDMHQIIMMAGTLTYRQVVLIRLICEGFKGISPEMFVTNPSACVEINRMRDYGLWMTDMAMFKNDASATIQVKLLKPTNYTQMVYDALMLEIASMSGQERIAKLHEAEKYLVEDQAMVIPLFGYGSACLRKPYVSGDFDNGQGNSIFWYVDVNK